MNTLIHRNTVRCLTSAVAIAAASLLAACDRPNDQRTAGQQLDSTIAKVQQKSAEMTADARDAGKDAMQAAGKATTKVADSAKDAAITAAVKTKLLADASLNALKVNVDTEDGHVTLKGSAPDPMSRDQASALASQVDGVIAVDNRLVVAPKG